MLGSSHPMFAAKTVYLWIFAAAFALACEAKSEASKATESHSVLKSLPGLPALNPRKVALGGRLFRDPILSQDGSIACSSCHDLQSGGADHVQYSVGIHGSKLRINTPTVFNAGLNFRQFWDGRALNLEDQIDGPVTSPLEMGSTWPQIIMKLTADKYYRDAFQDIYGSPISTTAIKDALATFERSLQTPNSRFDQFLNGNADAISSEEKAGYDSFRNLGCISCHQGANIGANMYQVFGVIGDYFKMRGNPSDVDLGRFNITGKEGDRFVFKVPTLRNIALTAPYFHDGSVDILADAVRIMGQFQLGRSLSEKEVNDLVAFLKTLTGKYSGEPQ